MSLIQIPIIVSKKVKNKQDDLTPNDNPLRLTVLLCVRFLKVSSQHPYAEQYIGRPHVMTVDFNNSLEFDSAIREIVRTKVLIHTVNNKGQKRDCKLCNRTYIIPSDAAKLSGNDIQLNKKSLHYPFSLSCSQISHQHLNVWRVEIKAF